MAKIEDILHSDIFSHLTNITYLPRWGVLLLDIMLALIAYAISYLLGSSLLEYHMEMTLFNTWQQLLILLSVQVVFFWVFHTYSGILRFSTFVDTIKVAASVICSGLLVLTANVIIEHSQGAPAFFNSVLAIYIFVAMVLLIACRVTIKTSFEYMSQHNGYTKKVFIYGVQSAGIAIAKMLLSNTDAQYRPIGFISDDHIKFKHNMVGLPCYPKDDKIIDIMRDKGATCVIVSPHKMKEIVPAKDLAIFLNNDINVLNTPYFSDFSLNEENNPTPHIGSIESIKVEDLLERPTIKINTEHVGQCLNGKVVMITGAAGSIGSEIVRQVSHYSPSLIVLLEMAESPLHDLTLDVKNEYPQQNYARVIADVRNREMMEQVFAEYHPDVVFHAAAYKHVPLMEEYPTQAVLANVLGTKNVADMAVKYGTGTFVMISTDKAVNPTNVMGCSKRIAEIYVQSLYRKLQAESDSCTRFITTRFGNVLGSNGSVIPYFKKQIAAGGPVTVTHPDIIRYFMTIPEASCLVLEAATLGKGGEIFCFSMGKPVRIADLAKNMIRLAGFIPGRDIQIVYTGLRPGEKLYEELLNNKERTLPTPNEKILIAKVRESDFDQISEPIEHLIQLASEGKAFPTVQQMKKLVPEYKSKNSVFEQLDHK